MAKVYFRCLECKSDVTAETIVFDLEGNVMLRDKAGHSVTYTGLIRQ